MPPKLPYYVIESNRPGYTVIDMSKNDQYADLLKAEANRSLPTVPTQAMNRAVLHQRREMVDEQVPNEYGRSVFKFRDEIILAQADERGRIFIEKEKPDLARRILAELRILDHTTKLDPMGAMLPEEDPNSDKPRNLGGRPRKNPVY